MEYFYTITKMFDLICLSLFVIVTVCIFSNYWNSRKWNFPPGPWTLPILSGIIGFGDYPHITFHEWAKKYGPLVKTKLGMKDVLIINDPKLLREAFNNPDFNGRMNYKTFTIISGGQIGMFNAEGHEWVEQRRFVVRTLRDFGLGKREMEDYIHAEIQEFLDWLKTNEGLPTAVARRLVLATLNSLFRLIAGEPHDPNSEIINEIIYRATRLFNDQGRMTKPLIIYPQLIHILPRVFLKKWNLVVKRSKPYVQIFQDAIDQHVSRFLPNAEPRDLIDVYLAEIKKTTDTSSSFYGERGLKTLNAVIGDLYGAGQSTSSNILNWAILYLAHFRNLQTKLHAELDAVVGPNRVPRVSDRPRLPFSEALALEVQRFSSFAPIGVFHKTLEDSQLGGYGIKKGTIVIPNFYSINQSKEIWGDPESFRPERFLSSDGQTVLPNEDFMPFGTGKRRCIGESLGKDILFLFLTNIFHRFEISADPANPLPPLDGPPGFFLEPHDFVILAKSRVQ